MLSQRRFKEIEYNLSIVLTMGLLLTTLLRGYFSLSL